MVYRTARFSSFNRQSFASLRANRQFLAPPQRQPFNSLSESSLPLFQSSIDPAARDQSAILSGRRRAPRTAGCLAGLIRSAPSRRFGPRGDGHFQLPPPRLDVPGSLLQPPLQIPRDSLGGYVHPADESIGHAQDKVDIEHAVEEVVKAAGRSHGGSGFLEKLLQLLRFLLLPPRHQWSRSQRGPINIDSKCCTSPSPSRSRARLSKAWNSSSVLGSSAIDTLLGSLTCLPDSPGSPALSFAPSPSPGAAPDGSPSAAAAVSRDAWARDASRAACAASRCCRCASNSSTTVPSGNPSTCAAAP